MFDFNKFIEIIKGGLLEPRPTWESYLAENPDWKTTAMQLTLPLILISAVGTAILSWVFRSHSIIGMTHGGLATTLLGIVFALLGITVVSFVYSFFAGMFQGEHNFNRGLAAVSLAAIPGYIGNVLGPIPWLGWIISLAMAIVSLVLLYKIIPLYLKVPDHKRALHFVVSLVASFVAAMILGTVLGLGSMSSRHPGAMLGDSTPAGNYGTLGGLGRHAELMEAAEQDRFDAPADGRVSEAQMESYLRVLRRTAELRQTQARRLEELERAQGDKEVTVSDLDKLSTGLGSVLTAANAELEVVKTAGGNWAEHRWVKNQLRTASIQKDINEAVRHNYALYRKHAVELEKYGIP